MVRVVDPMPHNTIDVRNASVSLARPRGESAARQRRWQAYVNRLTALIADHILTRLQARPQAAAQLAPLSRRPARAGRYSAKGSDGRCGPA
jgi:hypothetical protein